ncbi:bifunctional alpha/beta hydrolase/OsmC family protein [Elongatibacter sediminis]|uniref:Alpha/beta fold hydrolase n=1 Tax=Elongatibacter sediminis TaxID=3119006 RepID=A0AAW9RLG2_9GAMM
MQEVVRFENRGGQQLTGSLHRPDAGRPRAWALFAHCFTCTRNVKAAVNIAEALSREGIATLRFDFTGLGQSEGEFADTHFSSNVDDLEDAAAFLREAHEAPQILVGHSLGGTACLQVASRIDEVRAVATLGSPAEAEHILHLLDDDLERIEEEGAARVKLAGRSFTIRRDFLEDVRSQSVRDGIGKLRRALLVMHSPVDEVVSIDEAARIYTSARHPKSFISLDGADHLLSDERDSRFAGAVLASWAARYMERDAPAIPEAHYAGGETVVVGRAEHGFRVSINADGHRMRGDEPESVGGAESGPTPYDLLSAALASCTVMTVNMYARHKGLPLESVEVRVRHGKIHAKDCTDCETRKGKIDRFERVLNLTGDLDADQRQRLLEIADRCPVHRTLHGEVRIESRLGD